MRATPTLLKNMIRFKTYYLLFALLGLLIVPGCEKKTEVKTPSSETKLTAIVFAANDSFPGLKDAEFKVDFSSDTAIVYNPDSLPVGTRIDSVVATFYFSTNIGYARFWSYLDTTIILTSDTLNFTPQPCYLHVVSEDMKHERDYKIYVNVHTVDPDLYVWSRTREHLIPQNCDVHAENLRDTVLLFTHDGISTALYRSTDGKEWSGPVQVTGLPRGVNIRQICKGKDLLYYAEGQTLYTSLTGAEWTAVDCSGLGLNMQSALFYYNDSVWTLAKDMTTNELWFTTMKEGELPAKQMQIGVLNRYCRTAGERFPVSDFSAITFIGQSGRRRAMVMGGYDTEGQPLNSRWNLEWVDTDTTAGYYRLENFTIEQPEFSAITGAALVWYDYKMLLFGALENGATITQHPVLESIDEGMNWTVPDSAQNKLPEEFTTRQRQAIVITKDKAILLIGGQNRTTSFTDVWRGKKNSIDWY